MDKKLIALASSDWHYHDWKQFNEEDARTLATNSFLSKLFWRSHDEKIPILFPGDLFHTPKGVSTKVLGMFTKLMSTVREVYPKSKLIGTTGNHEQDQGYSNFNSMAECFWENMLCIDNQSVTFTWGTIYGLPYRKRNINLVKEIKELSQRRGPKILLLHTELYGAPDPSGYEATPQNFSRESLALFKDFDLVLAGHVHKHTQVADNVYMVGAPNQQRKSDAGTEMGYLEIYNDFSVKFIKWHAPKFRTFHEGEEHEDTNDYWTEIPKPKKLKKSSEAEFKPTMDKTEMAKRYAKETGVKSPKKINALINILNKTDE